MASTGVPVCRQCRREGTKLYLKGYRCYGKKCPFSRPEAPFPPGQHGRGRPSKLSDYGQQLREKQKLRRIYGLREKQFRLYVREAERRRGVTGENLLQLLEMRLDNVVFRLGFAASRLQARQFVSHGHIRVNGRKVHIPSYQLRPGDRVDVVEESRKMQPLQDAMKAAGTGTVPPWLKLDAAAYAGEVLSAPQRDEINTDVQEALIVEFYSR
ncbi:MAG: 30S ribosomal protein S4 [Armatimonadota bacterium]|jgi:small subunit ribosomal protein S4|nr:MAG: 30S ribosomal protein S4 [Armatimonadota bacterium]